MKVLAFLVAIIAMVLGASTGSSAQTTKYKCMVQMSNYMGDGAYIVVSLISPKGEYEKTLYVLGSDKRWYHDWEEWYKFQTKKKENISAITGASLSGGDRSMTTMEIENAKIDKGYKIRFESAVEDGKYNLNDVSVPLTTQALTGKTDGTGYIRYVRFLKIQ